MVTTFVITLFVFGSIAGSHADELVSQNSPGNWTVKYEPTLGSMLPKENLSLATSWIDVATTTLCTNANKTNVATLVKNALVKLMPTYSWVVIVKTEENGWAGDKTNGDWNIWSNVCKPKLNMLVWNLHVNTQRKCSFMEQLAAQTILSSVGSTIYDPAAIVKVMDEGESIVNLQHYLTAAWIGNTGYATSLEKSCAVYNTWALYYIWPGAELECFSGKGDAAKSVGCDSFLTSPVGDIFCEIGDNGKEIIRRCVDSAYAEMQDIPEPGEDGSSCVVREIDDYNQTSCLCAWDNCNIDFETAASDAGQPAFFLPTVATILCYFYLL